MSADQIELVQNLGQPRVLVVGDLMLDRYVWGDAERISQEAPVVLLQADRREERLGGASSVATMLRALGARVALAGVVGADEDGKRVRSLLRELVRAITRQLGRADVVLVSDYDKGVCTPGLLAGVIAAARAAGVRTLAD